MDAIPEGEIPPTSTSESTNIEAILVDEAETTSTFITETKFQHFERHEHFVEHFISSLFDVCDGRKENDLDDVTDVTGDVSERARDPGYDDVWVKCADGEVTVPAVILASVSPVFKVSLDL